MNSLESTSDKILKRRHSCAMIDSKKDANSECVNREAYKVRSNSAGIASSKCFTNDEFNFDKPMIYIENDNFNNIIATKAVKQLKNLAQALNERGEAVKKKISKPMRSPSPDMASLKSDHSVLFEEQWMKNMDITRATQLKKTMFNELRLKYRNKELGVFEPQSPLYITWLLIVSLAFGYNAVGIFLRCIFPYENATNRYILFIFDYMCDAIYLTDIMVFKIRLKYVHDGQWIDDLKLIRKNYLRKNRFWFDLISLIPFDLLYLIYGCDKPLLRVVRLNRLFKIQTFWEFFNRIDAMAMSPYVIRIVHTLIYKIYLIHLSTCAYYLVSLYEGFGSTTWTYNNKGNAYIRCFYFAFRTATSIGGRMPKPTNDLELFYMILNWLMGVFVFALLIGQIRDIVATATQNKTQYRNIINQTVRYMKNLNLPHTLQKRVRLWLTFTWAMHKTFDENKILTHLPLKLRTDLALSIHYHTLSKVQLFKDCDRNLLRDLVLKLRSMMFLPGDYVCRIGDVGQEMYIVNSGCVHVMGGDNGKTVLATLSEGSVFGEVAILGIDGYLRRTADVRSIGYSNLFVLSKSDLWDTLKYYPEYEKFLRHKVRHFLKVKENGNNDNNNYDRINDELDINDIPHVLNQTERTNTPKLLQTVLQVMPQDFQVYKMLSSPSRISDIQSQLSVSSSRNTPLLTSNASFDKFSDEVLQYETLDNKYTDKVDDKIINQIINS